MEFRIEVVFETPVIFLAAAPELSRKPTNGKANWDTAPETVPKLQSSLGYF
jgi:hypothetical protein